jgi:hypothetical protein
MVNPHRNQAGLKGQAKIQSMVATIDTRKESGRKRTQSTNSRNGYIPRIILVAFQVNSSRMVDENCEIAAADISVSRGAMIVAQVTQVREILARKGYSLRS